MQCPRCGNEVPARPICERCGAPMFQSPAMSASAPGPVTVPLTIAQKARLLAGCVPLVGFTVMVAGYMILVQRAIIPPPTPLFYLLIAAVLLVVGYQALQRLRDLASGVALAQEDLLNHTYTARGGQGRVYGHFAQLGKLRISPRDRARHPAEQRYRVLYSPASKIAWALERLDAHA